MSDIIFHAHAWQCPVCLNYKRIRNSGSRATREARCCGRKVRIRTAYRQRTVTELVILDVQAVQPLEEEGT